MASHIDSTVRPQKTRSRKLSVFGLRHGKKIKKAVTIAQGLFAALKCDRSVQWQSDEWRVSNSGTFMGSLDDIYFSVNAFVDSGQILIVIAAELQAAIKPLRGIVDAYFKKYNFPPSPDFLRRPEDEE